MTSGNHTGSLLEHVEETIRALCADSPHRRPCVTLAYAQSLDGSIAAEVGATTFIGGSESRVLAHRLRAAHDAVLVGVNTVLVDDPQLNVRHVDGPNPRPIIVDSRLRTPVTARVLCGESPWIVTTHDACEDKAAQLNSAGAEILRVSANRRGGVDLAELFGQLRQRGINSVMVEGGARIITSVLQQQLAHQIVLTISPELLGGLRAVASLDMPAELRPRLENMHWCVLEDDLIVQGELTCNQPAAVGGDSRQNYQS